MAKPKIRHKKQTTIQLLLTTLEAALVTFKTSQVFKDRYHDGIGEDDLTSALRFHLDGECSNKGLSFAFETQSPQGNRRSSDIAVQLKGTNGDYIFFIEAKWTNAPDYVYSNTGAIKRFKNLDHGINNTNPNYPYKYVKESAVIGYHELKQNFQTTQKKINSKIQSLLPPTICEFGLTWDNTELLQSIKQGNFDSHISNHTRKDGSIITLYHLWIKIK
ncbi:hypothetical protein ACE193_19960 [Bernardetia sp. OM2101]|uniref:hypothetical protein n=1 Tax=Bernardetia sp. OM2101 TaxID=3344876 RepID=UPI0035D06176